MKKILSIYIIFLSIVLSSILAFAYINDNERLEPFDTPKNTPKVTPKTTPKSTQKSMGINVGKEITEHGPASFKLMNDTFFCWTGTDNRLNIKIVTGKKATLAEKSIKKPAVTVMNGVVYLAWTGTDNRLNIMQSRNGFNYYRKITLSETSDDAPTLTCDPINRKIFLSWTGKGNDKINILQSINGINWTGKSTLSEKSGNSPSLTYGNKKIYLAWTGANIEEKINIIQSINGISWNNKKTFIYSAAGAPSLTYDITKEFIYLGWRDKTYHTDRGCSFNIMQMDPSNLTSTKKQKVDPMTIREISIIANDEIVDIFFVSFRPKNIIQYYRSNFDNIWNIE